MGVHRIVGPTPDVAPGIESKREFRPRSALGCEPAGGLSTPDWDLVPLKREGVSFGIRPFAKWPNMSASAATRWGRWYILVQIGTLSASGHVSYSSRHSEVAGPLDANEVAGPMGQAPTPHSDLRLLESCS